MKNKLIRPLPVLLVLLFISSSCIYTKKTQQRLYKRWAENKTYDMIVVPGIPLEDSLKWDRIMKGRVYWAKFLYDKGIAKNIMFSGSAVYTPYYEAKVMALYAEAIGIPKEHIFTETKAEHSTENLYYSYKKSKQLGFKTIALASDPFQTKLLRRYAHSRIDKNIGIIPFVEDSLILLHPIMTTPDIDHQQAFKENFVSLPKRESLWKRLKGTLGWSIDKKAYK